MIGTASRTGSSVCLNVFFGRKGRENMISTYRDIAPESKRSDISSSFSQSSESETLVVVESVEDVEGV